MAVFPTTSIHTNPAADPRQNANASTPPSITGLAKSALEQGPANAASLADRAVDDSIDQRKYRALAKTISENRHALKH